jgi:hypothetical protein
MVQAIHLDKLAEMAWLIPAQELGNVSEACKIVAIVLSQPTASARYRIGNPLIT